MKITVGFSKPKNKLLPWFSWLIRLYQGTDYSHVYLRWDIENLPEKLCYQASGLQVNFIGQSAFDSEIQPVIEYKLKTDISPQVWKKLMSFCIDNAGKPYGVKDVFGLLWARLFKKKVNPLDPARSAWVCSGLVACILEDVFLMNLGIDFSIATPKDVELFLEKSPLFEKTL